jgi:hypothetical protein
VPCELSQASCPETFVRSFGRRAFRRPLDEDEVAEYLDLFSEVAGVEDATGGVEAVVAAMLMSPHFLYVGAGDEEPKRRAHQLASRLSYFVWSSMPDEELLAAAEHGGLADREGLEDQVRRMLDDPRAADMLEVFHRQWLEFDSLEDAFKDPELFPQWNRGLAQAMLDETRRFVERVVVQEDGRLHTLLTASYGWLTPELADLYGVTLPESEDAGWATLPAQRAGLLTRGAVLAQHAHAAEVSWVHRGLLVREQLLCQVLPSPPNDVDTNAANDPDRMEDPACVGCHVLIDPIGQGFDDYDPIGTHLASGAGGRVEGLDGGLEFEGLVELAEALAFEPVVHDCVTSHWFRYAHRRDLDADDACVFEGLRESFAESDGDIRELVVAIATADSFRMP